MPLDANAFNTLVGNPTPKGKTPLTEAAGPPGEACLDGSPGKRDPVQRRHRNLWRRSPLARTGVMAEGVNFTAHVIGFSVNANEKQLACLAESTGGLFLTADTEQQLSQALQICRQPRGGEPPSRPISSRLRLMIDQANGCSITPPAWCGRSRRSPARIWCRSLLAVALRIAARPGQYVAEASCRRCRCQGAVHRRRHRGADRAGKARRDAGQSGRTAASRTTTSSPAQVTIAGGLKDNIPPTGDEDFCGIDAPAPGVLTMAATAAPAPIQLVVRVISTARPSTIGLASFLPGAAPVGADLPEAGRYVLEVADPTATIPHPTSTRSAGFTPVVDATEPNESLTRPATAARSTRRCRSRSSRKASTTLAVEVEDHGELTLTAANAPPGSTTMRIYGPSHEILRDWQTAPAGVNEHHGSRSARSRPLRAGACRQLTTMRARRSPLSLTATFTDSVDANEPNNNTAAATRCTRRAGGSPSCARRQRFLRLRCAAPRSY